METDVSSVYVQAGAALKLAGVSEGKGVGLLGHGGGGEGERGEKGGGL